MSSFTPPQINPTPALPRLGREPCIRKHNGFFWRNIDYSAILLSLPKCRQE
jgi:hypothetical protein